LANTSITASAATTGADGSAWLAPEASAGIVATATASANNRVESLERRRMFPFSPGEQTSQPNRAREALAGCAALKRLAVVVQPLPEGQARVGEAFALIARRYVNQKRDFLVKVERFEAEAPALDALCGGDDAIEGVPWLHLTLVAKGEHADGRRPHREAGPRLSASAKLCRQRCA
jgi:hypothetical protein